MDKFEKIIKNSVENFEVPYSEEAWKSLSKKMGVDKGLVTKWIVGISASVIFISGLIFISTNDTAEKNELTSNETKLKTQNTIITKSENPIQINSNNDNQFVINQDGHTELAQDVKLEKLPTQRIDVKIQPNNTINTTTVADLLTIDKLAVSNSPDLIKVEKKSIGIDMSDNNIVGTTGKNDNAVDYSKFNIQVKADRSNLCIGQTVNITPSIPKIKAIYQWDLGDGNIIDGNYIEHTYKKPGNYQVTLSLLDLKTKKILKSSSSKFITVFDLPENHINLDEKDDVITHLGFTQTNTEYERIDWIISDLFRTSDRSFDYKFKYKGRYNVFCVVTDKNGCTSTASEHITVEKDYTLLAPNAFSPNGDNKNETFMPKALIVNELPFTLSIYDKAGRMVFQTTDANTPWDGLYTKDLKPAPEGTYIWVVNMTNENGVMETYKSHIIITR